MRRLFAAVLVCGFATAGQAHAQAPNQAVPASTPRGGPFVTSQWLAGHLSDPNLVLLYVGSDSVYRLSHIPGSRFVDLDNFSAPEDSAAMAAMHDPARQSMPHALTLELPGNSRLDSALAQAGVNARSTVVVTYEDWFTPAARILLTLEYAGLRDHAFLLDRSVSLWKSEGHQVTAAVPTVARGDYHTGSHADVVVDAKFVAAHLKDPRVRIIDARDAVFYDGTRKSRMNPRGGHIAGAHSIPYASLSDSAGHILPDAELRKIFAAAGVSPGDTVVSYCHIGQQGSFVWAAARELGFTVRLYDGSFEDWSMRSDLPVEGGK